jgi:hypothetical protein
LKLVVAEVDEVMDSVWDVTQPNFGSEVDESSYVFVVDT